MESKENSGLAVASSAPRSLMRLPAVLLRLGCRKSTLYRWVATGRFPAPLRLGARMSVWDSIAVDRWVEAQCARNPRDGAL